MPDVLEDSHMKRVLNFASTARTVTVFSTCKIHTVKKQELLVEPGGAKKLKWMKLAETE